MIKNKNYYFKKAKQLAESILERLNKGGITTSGYCIDLGKERVFLKDSIVEINKIFLDLPAAILLQDFLVEKRMSKILLLQAMQGRFLLQILTKG